jgi:hypothetical protein
MEQQSRNMRGMLKGKATGKGPAEPDRRKQIRALAEEALEGAVRSVMSNAPEALQRASQR